MPFWSRKKVHKHTELAADRETFCAALRARLDKAGTGYRYDDDQFAIFSEESGGVHFLRNAYDEYAASPAIDRAPVLSAVVERVRTPFPSAPDTWADARANVMPRLRDPAYYTSTTMQVQALHPDSDPPQFCQRAIAPGLALEPAYDLPTQIMAITQSQLSDWDVNADTVIEAALENLAVRTGDCFQAVAPGFYVCSTNDAYDSSRMALVDRIAALDLDGPPLAVAPHRDVLFITGAHDSAGRARLLEAVQQNLEAPRLAVFVPFVLIEGAWRRWWPAADDPLAADWTMLDIQLNGRNYGDLKRLLDESETGFLAKFNAIKTTEGEILSYSVYPAVAGGWLPRTDLVSVLDYDDPGEPMMLPWDTVAPFLRAVDDVAPPVFETLRDSNAALMAELAEASAADASTAR
ncbi:MAG: hypothetical protein ACI9U2_002526 [Bradymonadia bacterium]|jgi:hypothetical protein